MGTFLRTPFTLAGGIVIGLLIGGYVHTANAGTAPCTNPNLPVPPKGSILAIYDGDTRTTQPDDVGAFHGPKKFTYRGSITLTMIATQIDTTKNASGTPFTQADVKDTVALGDQIAIAPGDKPTQMIKETFSADANQCKFGCVVGIVEPTNLRWHIVVTK